MVDQVASGLLLVAGAVVLLIYYFSRERPERKRVRQTFLGGGYGW